MYGYRKSLILSSICHPIKFIWRFIIVFLILCTILGLITSNIYFLNNFLLHTKVGDIILFSLSAYMTMRWVRSVVEKEEYDNLFTPQPTKEDIKKEKAQKKALIRDCIVQEMMYQNQKRKREEAERARQWDWKKEKAREYYEASRTAHYNGDYHAEKVFEDEAKKYWNM